ncbi:MFS transporter [Komagataeibacter melomenusus]
MNIIKNRWLLLFILLVPVNFVLGIDRTALTISSAQVQQAIHIDPVVMAELITISTGIYALLQVPAGWFTHKVGVRWALSGACLLWSLATILTALQTSTQGFFAVRILLGIGQAPDWVACVFALKLLFSDKEREAASSTLLGGLYIGYAVSGVLTAYVLHTVGWRYCFMIYGAIGLVFSVIIFLCYGGPTIEPPVKKKSKVVSQEKEKIALFPVVQIALFYGCVSGVQGFCHVNFLHFLMSRFNISSFEAGRLFSVPSIALYIGVLISGATIKYMKRRETAARPFPSRLVRIIGLTGATGCMAGAILSPSLWLCMVFAVGAMGSVGLCQVLTWSHVQSFPRHTALVAGCTALMGNGVSSVAPVWSEMLFKHQHDWAVVAFIPAIYAAVGISIWFMGTRANVKNDNFLPNS